MAKKSKQMIIALNTIDRANEKSTIYAPSKKLCERVAGLERHMYGERLRLEISGQSHVILLRGHENCARSRRVTRERFKFSAVESVMIGEWAGGHDFGAQSAQGFEEFFRTPDAREGDHPHAGKSLPFPVWNETRPQHRLEIGRAHV